MPSTTLTDPNPIPDQAERVKPKAKPGRRCFVLSTQFASLDAKEFAKDLTAHVKKNYGPCYNPNEVDNGDACALRPSLASPAGT